MIYYYILFSKSFIYRILIHFLIYIYKNYKIILEELNMQYRNEFCSIKNKGTLSVKGNSYIDVEPDMIRLNFKITTQNTNLEEAKLENDKISNNVLSSLYNYGIPKNNIRSLDITVTRNYDSSTNTFLSYNVSHSISVTSTLDSLNDIYYLIIDNGANDDINIDFILSNPMYHYNRALKKATQDAICKASLLSKSFGLNHIPTPYKIIENSSSLYAITYSSSTNYTASKNITPNTVKITAEIEAKFLTFTN